MSGDGFRYTFGPVPSRRLGKSLGINNIPPKVCSYSCLYCQVGRTTRVQVDRRSFYDPGEILRDVQSKLAQAKEAMEQVDYLTFVPDGEPSLDQNLGRQIALLKSLGIPVGVISNSSLTWRNDVREELAKADWVSVKVDAVREATWRRINRPHKSLRLPDVLEGLGQFAQAFKGTLVTETMLLKGLNDGDEHTGELADFLQKLQPQRAYLSIPTRPPAEAWVRGPDEETLNRAYHILAEKVTPLEYLIGYEGNAFAYTGDVEKDLLGITAVHPMREEAVHALLSRAGAGWEAVDRLLSQGDLAETRYEGHKFYLRRFKQVLKG